MIFHLSGFDSKEKRKKEKNSSKKFYSVDFLMPVWFMSLQVNKVSTGIRKNVDVKNIVR